MDSKRTMINFLPSMDRVVVEPSEKKNMTAAGIHIPNSADMPLKGKILAVGEDVVGYAPGDIISYGKFAGTEILVDDKEYLIMRVNDIFGTFLFGETAAE